MLKKALLLTASSLCAFAMHSAEININNKDIEGAVRLDMAEYNDALEPNNVFVGARYMRVDGAHGDFAGKEDLLELSYLMSRELEHTPGLTVGLGVKADYIVDTGAKYFAMPVGIEAMYRLPLGFELPVRVGGSLYHAPEVLSFEDGQNYTAFRIQAEAELFRNAFATLGYRKIDTDFKSADATYNDAFYAGLKFGF